MLKAGFVSQRLSVIIVGRDQVHQEKTTCVLEALQNTPHARRYRSPIPSLSSCSPATPSATTTQKPNFADPRPPGQLCVVKGCLW